LKVCHCVQNTLPSEPTLRQCNPVKNFKTCILCATKIKHLKFCKSQTRGMCFYGGTQPAWLGGCHCSKWGTQLAWPGMELVQE
jgi:hypothetical protein